MDAGAFLFKDVRLFEERTLGHDAPIHERSWVFQGEDAAQSGLRTGHKAPALTFHALT